MTSVRIGSWNLCLGLQNKKDIVLDYLKENEIDICCLQETELTIDYPINILSDREYLFESEMNNGKSRVGVYVHKRINYLRRKDLE